MRKHKEQTNLADEFKWSHLFVYFLFAVQSKIMEIENECLMTWNGTRFAFLPKIKKNVIQCSKEVDYQREGFIPEE